LNFFKVLQARKASPGTLKLFSVFLKGDRARVESFYAERFGRFVNQANVKAAETQLDAGF
jgi:hypothetical protein